ncbi:MAG TPA: cytochrome P450 [Sphingobium sp.]|uniref:cytochrome P450 n=1 Tax=Sphingobium sp. TaxID=1912891 RepID=UPI002ED58DB8
MQALEQRDYFTDLSVLRDPYQYFEDMRPGGPVQWDSNGVLIVTGFEEALEILRNSEDFSSVISTSGPVVPLPFEPEGDDINAQIEAHRDEMAPTQLLVTYDGSHHLAARSLLNSLFTPSRLRANEEFMEDYAGQLVRDAVAAGECELINQIATPYVTLVIADLLGVPEEDRETFRKVIDAGPPPGDMEAADQPSASYALTFMAEYFARYIQQRRDHPQQDVLTELAHAKFPDGSTPDLMEVVKGAMFLFAAGQDTSAKLLGNAMRFLVEDQALQQRLRENPSLIPAFLEEALRLEGSTKGTFRLARRRTTVGGTDVPAGTRIMVSFAAANRDANRWPNPISFEIGRSKIKEHLAFGRGAHVCIGAPLARVEVRVLLERFLEKTSRIELSEAVHGPVGNRKLNYEPSYIIRGLERLNIVLTPP